MDIALVGARMLLASVFAVAGLAKLADRAGSRQTLVDFGVPAGSAAMLGVLLPLAELAVAAALILTSTAWWGALGALALLLLFVAGIGMNLARGRTPTCRCFGQLASSPVGTSTLVRNAVFAGVAGFVVWQGRVDAGPSLVAWLGDLTTAERVGIVIDVVGLGLLAGMAWILAHVLGQQGRLLLRLGELEQRLAAGGASDARHGNGLAATPPQGLPIGAPAPDFKLPDLRGVELTLEGVRAANKPLLLLFTDPDCGPCASLMPDIARWQREHADTLAIALISRSTPEASRAKAAEHGIAPVLLQRDYEVADAYQAYGTPSAVLVRPDGTIGSSVAPGAEAIRSLVGYAIGRHEAQPWVPPVPVPMVNGHGHDHHGHQHDQASPSTVKIGEPAPSFKLPGLDGDVVDLDDFRGSRTLVLFWNPGCGFCQQMLPDLKAWEANLPERAPKLLVVSTGSVEDNRAMGLRAPIALDQDFAAGSAFGAGGTPTAVVVDARGRFASDLAVGAPAVLALAGASSSPASPPMGSREVGRQA